MNPQEGTVLIQSDDTFVRMLILIKSRSGLKLDHVGSKTRSLGQIIENPFVHSKRAQFSSEAHETLSKC